MSAEPSLMGLENELLVGASTQAKRGQLASLWPALMERLRRSAVGVPNAESNVNPVGLMLSNGGRVYLDLGYLENATPEVLCPRQGLVYQRANEFLLSHALEQASAKMGLQPGDITLTRIVTDYAVPEEHFCGAHLNVLGRRHSLEELVTHFLPFLVTRWYAGAGGLGDAGLTMTQKNRAVRCVASNDPRENRGLILLGRQESLSSAPFQRFHVTHGDALMSDLGLYLTVACTALVLKMLDDGVSIGCALALADPLGALRQLDRDPTWSQPLRLASGGEASGLEIQEHYLKAAERYVRRGTESWMVETVQRWRAGWEALKNGPQHLAAALDPFIKRRLYTALLAAEGMSVAQFNQWCTILTLLEPHLPPAPLPASEVGDRLRDHVPRIILELLNERIRIHNLTWNDLPRARTIWKQLKFLDLSYHDIHPDRGLFWRLRSMGFCNSCLVSDKEIRLAMGRPPAGTRAAARGMAILQVKDDRSAAANWTCVTAGSRGTMQLHNPFNTRGVWVKPPPK